jgi:DNA-directed RNA polymerase specialized sigma24 family protein
LNSSDSPSESPDSTELQNASGASTDKTKAQKTKWSLNTVALDKLLDRFSTNRDEAGIQYELARRKVIRYFEWRCVVAAEACADETMDRVARRIDEGQKVDKLMAYIFAVARHIFQEVLREEQERPQIGLDDAPPEWLRQKPPEIVDPDIREICFDRCLEGLGSEGRNLILGYYEGEGRAKIDHRLQLARKLKIPLNALRIRVHRLKRTLEDCIAECLKNGGAKQIVR